ncbi:MAG: alpha/beta fold hydrolase [Acidobacteriaceae bacterium]
MSTVAENWLTPFLCRPLLSNGHLQTLAGNFLPRKYMLPEPERLLVEVEGPVSGYGPSYVLCHCHWQPEEVRSQRLTVVLVHGLEGSSNSKYMIGNTARALAAGFNVVRMNMRSCGGTDDICPTIYHSGRSGDVAAVFNKIVEMHKLEAIALVGYSMGGNLVLKFAGETAAAPPKQLKALVGVSPLMDLALSSAALHERQNRVYEWHFLRNMVARVRRRMALYSKIYGGAELAKIRSMRLFDDHIVARYGGFASAEDYYEKVASSHFADKLSVPTLILHSADDPFIRLLPTTRAALIANPNVTYIETEGGGHCAFLEATRNGDDGRWAERTLLGFLQARAHGS